MSVYFSAKPEYFRFIKELETEGEEYRQLHYQFRTLSQKSKDEFKNCRNKINAALNTIKPPVRGTRAAEVSILQKKKPQKKAATRLNTPKSPQILANAQNSNFPTPYYATEMPVRKNSAQRILNPRRIQKYKENNREPPILIGKGVDTLNIELSNQASRTLSSYNFNL